MRVASCLGKKEEIKMEWWRRLTRFVIATAIAVVGLIILLTINTAAGKTTDAVIIAEIWLTAGFACVILGLGIKNFKSKKQ